MSIRLLELSITDDNVAGGGMLLIPLSTQRSTMGYYLSIRLMIPYHIQRVSRSEVKLKFSKIQAALQNISG